MTSTNALLVLIPVIPMLPVLTTVVLTLVPVIMDTPVMVSAVSTSMNVYPILTTDATPMPVAPIPTGHMTALATMVTVVMVSHVLM